jgi:hypothetical protein
VHISHLLFKKLLANFANLQKDFTAPWVTYLTRTLFQEAAADDTENSSRGMSKVLGTFSQIFSSARTNEKWTLINIDQFTEIRKNSFYQ